MALPFLLLFLIHSILSMQTSNPIWKTSIYFRAGQQNVISSLTGNSSTPQYTFVFSSALTGVPNIAYGIAKYQGADTLLDERFQIFRIGLTSTSFSVAVQITGFTNLHLLQVAYLAIEPTFPHHLNTFDNIPVNYSGGPMVNFTIRQSNFSDRSASQRTYLNIINYTEQSAGRKYDRFTTPVDRYKIVLIMTSLFVSTQRESNASQNFSMDLRMESRILSEETYQVYVKLKVSVIVTRLHFSQIVFDPADIESSYKYKLLYQLWTLNNFGGQKMIPEEFKDNFIMGLTEFTSKLGYCGFDYMWDWLETDSFFGVKIYESITRTNLCAFVRITSSVVYVQAWQCLAPYYYYNHTTGLCQDQCGMYFYPTQKFVDIEIEYSCLPCDWACSKCNSSQKCLSCNSDDMRLFNGSCYCPNGYVDTLTVTKCQPCLSPNCIICEKNPNYKSNPLPDDPITASSTNLCLLCDQGYILNDTTKSCNPWARCDSSNNELLNYQTNQCQVCLISGCSQCRQSMQIKFNGTIADVRQVGTLNRVLAASSPFGVVSCGLCDQQNQFFNNLTTKNCEKCTLNQCLNCSSLYTCAKCNVLNQYFVNQKTKLCDKCTLQGCVNCQNLTACRSCNAIKGYFLLSDTKLCKFCGLGCSDCQFSASGEIGVSSCQSCSSGLVYFKGKCTCAKDNTCQCSSSNYMQSASSPICQKKDTSIPDIGYAMNPSTGQVAQICGDGVRLTLECDDGNLVNKDGCSSECKIEQNFVCSGQVYDVSVCQYIGNISIAQYNVTKDPFDNLLDISLQMIPELVLYQSLDWLNGLYFTGSPKVSVISASMTTADVLNIKAKYYQNIKSINIIFGDDLSKKTSSSHITKSASSSISSSSYSSPSTRSTINMTFNFVQTKIDLSHTTNNLQVAFYPENTYSTIKLFQLLFTIIMVIYVGLVLAAVFFFKRIVPVMVIFVSIQLCFVSLTSIQNFQPQTFSIINNFDEVFGLNNLENSLTQCSIDQINPINLKSLQFKACFASNLNLMVVFEIVAIFGTILMLIVEYFWLQKLGQKYGGYFKRCLMNLILFNLSNAVISLGLIQLKQLSIIDIAIVCSQVFLPFVHFVLMFKFRKIYFIQVEIGDYQTEIMEKGQNQDMNFSSSSENNQKSQKSQHKNRKSVPEGLFEISSKKQSNQEVSSGEMSGQEQRKLDDRIESQRKSAPQNINKQIIYFAIFMVTIGIVCPMIYFLSSERYPLFCNVATIGAIFILILFQKCFQPFLVPFNQNDNIQTNRQQQTKYNQTHFSFLSYNYYISYGLVICFLIINILFSSLEQRFHDDVQQKVKVMSILSYGQVVTFLLFMSYLLIGWGYSAYLSFFSQDVLLRFYKSQDQSQQKQQASNTSKIDQVSDSSKSDQREIIGKLEKTVEYGIEEERPSSSGQQSESASIAEVLNKYRRKQSGYTGASRNLMSTISRPYETIDYDNEFMPTPKPYRRMIPPTLQDSQDLIFQMEQDSVQEERF